MRPSHAVLDASTDAARLPAQHATAAGIFVDVGCLHDYNNNDKGNIIRGPFMASRAIPHQIVATTALLIHHGQH